VALMARSLVRAGHEVHVLTQPHPGLPERTPEGARLHAVSLEEGDAGRDAYPYFPQRYAMAVHVALSRLHRAHPFDVIELPEFYGEGAVALKAHRLLKAYAGATLAVRLHTPSVVVRELNEVGRLGGEEVAIDVMERDSLRDADCVLSPTRALLDMARARFGPFVREQVLAHPFDARWAADLGVAQVGPPTGGPRRILYFGRLERRKGVHLLLPALEGLLRRGLDVELVLLGNDTPTGPGETSMRQALERAMTPELAGRVRFEPGRGREALGEEITSATVCCFPSVWENFPNVCLEAMAMGRPVVASDGGGMAEILEDGASGLLFQSGDVASLEAALARVLTEDGLAERLAEGARRRLEQVCSPQRIAETFVSSVPGASKPPRVASAGEKPLVSTVIPYFNLARTLPETLASIEAQTHRELEILVVDDGSTELESRALVDELARAGRIQLIRQPNRGLSAARNAGLRAARGEYVLPLDADDALEPTFVEKTVEVLESRPELSWCTSYVAFFGDEDGAPAGGWVPLGHAPEWMSVENLAGSCTAVFRRDVLVEAGGYDESLPSFEDWDLYCTLIERGLRGELIPEFLFRYRIRSASLAHAMAPALRHALRAALIAKHPTLVNPAAMRRLLAEADGLREELSLPRHALADRVNDTLKRLPVVHHVLKLGFRK
jgi:glycosyltransferase involved in cell wall biosynthesis/GT2 family glycosyltransferase